MADETAKPAGLPPPQSTKSFWHSQPSSLLVGHRSTRDLPPIADIVIVGSGITGASMAHHLLNDASTSVTTTGSEAGKGPTVVMLEAREACWGATGRNGGHCQPLLYEHPDDPSIGHFELSNFHAIASLINTKNIQCEFVAQPGVRGIYSKHHLAEVEAALNLVHSNAPALESLLRLETEQSELQKLRLRPGTGGDGDGDALGAIVTSVAARMWPYKFVAKILEDLLTATNPTSNGKFNLQTLTPAESLNPTSDGKWSISTPRGLITANRVLLATNAYTSHLLPAFSSLIVPCRGQMSALIPPPSFHDANRLATSYGFLGDGIDDYLIQRPSELGGHLMFGGGRQNGPSLCTVDDSIIDENTAAYLRSRLPTVLTTHPPQFTESISESPPLSPVNEWTGIMGFSQDDLPWVGPVVASLSPAHAPNLFLAAGYTGHGMPNAWLCGKAVAMMAARSLVNADTEWLSESVSAEVGVPRAYRITEERVRSARLRKSVVARDWAETHRGQDGV